ncbi:MAG TPA: MFS transporter [Chloroflexia bacterium]|nr:MFS transporter [Chloroflexia bacterium]
MAIQWLRRRITANMLWEFPELGIVVLGVFVVWVGLCSVWPILTLYMQAQGSSLADISVTTAAAMAASFLFQVPMGWASDRFGRKPLLLGGLALVGTISCLYLLVHSSLGFAILRFVEGIGGAAMMPAARAYLMDTIPPARRGQAFGLLGAAFNGGILLGPAIGGLLGGLTGMTGPFWLGAISSLIAFTFLALKVREHRGPHPHTEPDAREAAGLVAARVQWRAILPVFFSTIGWGFVSGFFSVVWNIWIHDLGGNLDIIGLSYTLFALPLIFVGPWAGRLADRRSRVLMILLPSLVAAAIYYAYGFLRDLPVILILGILEGAMIGILAPASDSYMADVLPPALRGRLQGLVSTTNTGAGFVGALICGPLYALGPFYLFMLLGSIHVVCAVVASALMLPTERRLRGPAPAAPGVRPAPVLDLPGQTG